MIHGKTCPKFEHLGPGYLHGRNDDSPYDVDGTSYCGRCHSYLDDRLQEKVDKAEIGRLQAEVVELKDRLVLFEQVKAELKRVEQQLAEQRAELILSKTLLKVWLNKWESAHFRDKDWKETDDFLSAG